MEKHHEELGSHQGSAPKTRLRPIDWEKIEQSRQEHVRQAELLERRLARIEDQIGLKPLT
ncbi:hypothetical protein [Pseudomonas cremoricolorata]|uniref:Transposase n=1 Tax=Pseudomonas cremoricolorata TaxID=157783 RepID=A0A089WTL8_9PSED|nr:hypothetical protein [Pseudomonas cremoricolorata]AIR90529.1 hypothetical protein LK03_15095 [Pseudomonas cremoricolorata]